MKDELGHGSDSKGAHSQGVQATPQLQRRHFEAIAAELKGRSASPDEVHAMADKLATTNPGFRRDFFVKAATGGDYTNKSRSKNTDKELSRFKKANPGFSFGRDAGSGQVTGYRKVK